MTTTSPPDSELHARSIWVRVSLALLALTVIGFSWWVSQFDRSPGWSGPALAVATLLTLAGIIALTKSWGDRSTRLGAAGFALVALGSGIGRPRDEFYTFIGSGRGTNGRGDVIGRLDTWTPMLVIGLILAMAAVVACLAANRRASPSAWQAPVSLFVVSMGYITVAVIARDLTVGSWIA